MGGTTNYVVKFTSATTIGNTVPPIFDNGTSIGIGTTTPAASAILDLVSTSQGFLVPRMTDAQRTAIASPATGLMVYVTDVGVEGLYINKSTGWFQII